MFSVIIFLIVTLFKEWLKPAMAFFLGTLLLLIVGIISPKETLSGFANEQLAVIVLLLLLSNVFRKSRGVYGLFSFSPKNWEAFPFSFFFFFSGTKK